MSCSNPASLPPISVQESKEETEEEKKVSAEAKVETEEEKKVSAEAKVKAEEEEEKKKMPD